MRERNSLGCSHCKELVGLQCQRKTVCCFSVVCMPWGSVYSGSLGNHFESTSGKE